MSDFVPPYPPRLASSPTAWRRLALGRENFLAMWEDSSFEAEFSVTRLFRRRSVLCNSPDSVQFALSARNASFERKGPQMRHALAPLLGDGLFVSDGRTWRQRRALVAPIVHTSRLGDFAPAMVEAASEVAGRWRARAGQEIDILSESAHLTAEIICRTLFGQRLGRGRAEEIVQGFSLYQSRIGQTDLASLFGLPEWFPRWQGGAIRATVRRMHGVIDAIVAEHKSSRAGDGSIVRSLVDWRDPETGEPLGPEAIRNEASVLFMAGHETTANALAWTWYLLSQAPAVEARLHEELDAVLGGRPASLADMPRLVYTRAIFEEAMRLYPPVPILTREAVADESFQGHAIPKGSLIFVVPWLLHRHRKLWERPDHFVPERFLPENAAAISKFAYIPFSIGPRVCAGLSFGLTEAVLCLATLAGEFRLTLRPGYTVRPVARLSLRPDGGIPMTVERRAPAATIPLRDTTRPAPACPVAHG